MTRRCSRPPARGCCAWTTARSSTASSMATGRRDLVARAQARVERARREGLAATLRQLLAAAGGALAWVALLPLTLLLHLAGYRRLDVIAERIGHLAAEVDCFLKARALGELPER